MPDLLSRPRSVWRNVVGAGALFLVAAELGRHLALAPAAFVTFWPPAGVFLAFVLLVPERQRAVVIVGLIGVNFAFATLVQGLPVPLAGGYTLANAAEAIVGAALIRRAIPGRRAGLRRMRDVFALIGLGAVIAPIVGATLGTGTAALFGAGDFLALWPLWWVADCVGVVLATPLLIMLAGLRLPIRMPRASTEIALALVATALVSALAFVVAPGGLPIAFVLFPLLLWPALRLGANVTSLSIAIVAVSAVIGTAHGGGPFALPTFDDAARTVVLQGYLSMLAICSLLVAALLHEREDARADVENANLGLQAALASLRAERELAAQIVESSHDGIIAFDGEFRYTLWSAAMARLSGIEAPNALGHSAFALFPFLRGSPAEGAMRATLSGTASAIYGAGFTRPDGTSGLFDASYAPLRDGESGEVVGGVAVIRDATERSRLENELRDAQKIEALGQLTGGVAHDFNNLLTIIIPSLDIILRNAGDGERVVRHAQVALDAAERGADVVRRLLAFARRQPLSPRLFAPDEAARALRSMLRGVIGVQIELDIEPSSGVWQVHADHNQFEVALLNLAANARDAMPEGGRIAIGFRNCAAGAASLPTTLPPGEYVAVSLRDTGQGMPPEILARAGEPFFTTKPVGRGTGLGLAQASGFTRQSGGALRVESVAGTGTTVTLFLPRAAPVPGPAELPPLSPETTPTA